VNRLGWTGDAQRPLATKDARESTFPLFHQPGKTFSMDAAGVPALIRTRPVESLCACPLARRQRVVQACGRAPVHPRVSCGGPWPVARPGRDFRRHALSRAPGTKARGGPGSTLR
jgi:hypothetical protein